MKFSQRYRNTPPGFKGLLSFVWALFFLSVLGSGYFAAATTGARGTVSAVVERQCGDSPALTWIQHIELAETVRPRDLVKISFASESNATVEVTETFLSSSHVNIGDPVAMRFQRDDPTFAFRADRLWTIPLSGLVVALALSILPLLGSSSPESKLR